MCVLLTICSYLRTCWDFCPCTYLCCVCVFAVDMTFPAFSMEACRTMICMLDTDDSGTLDFDEFKTLLEYVSKWKVSTHVCTYMYLCDNKHFTKDERLD